MPVDDYSFISSICLNCGFMLGEFVPVNGLPNVWRAYFVIVRLMVTPSEIINLTTRSIESVLGFQALKRRNQTNQIHCCMMSISPWHML